MKVKNRFDYTQKLFSEFLENTQGCFYCFGTNDFRILTNNYELYKSLKNKFKRLCVKKDIGFKDYKVVKDFDRQTTLVSNIKNCLYLKSGESYDFQKGEMIGNEHTYLMVGNEDFLNIQKSGKSKDLEFIVDRIVCDHKKKFGITTFECESVKRVPNLVVCGTINNKPIEFGLGGGFYFNYDFKNAKNVILESLQYNGNCQNFDRKYL